MENIMRVLETLKLEQEIGLDYTHQLEVSTNINFDDKEMYVASIVSIHEGTGSRYQVQIEAIRGTLMDAITGIDAECHQWLVDYDTKQEELNTSDNID